jgi:uncharacterized protein (TIGR03067 family)
MKYLLLLLLVLSVGACNISKHSRSSGTDLNGEWKPFRQEMGGRELPETFWQNQLLVINDTTYILTAESVDKGSVKYSEGKMDIRGREGVNTGKHFLAIYKLSNGVLSVCYNLKGDKYPAEFSTQGNPLYFLSEFRKKAK